MDNEKTVKLRYSARSNITYKHEADTGMSSEEWNELSEAEKAELATDLLFADIEWTYSS